MDRPLLVPHARYRWDALRQEHQLLFPEGMLVLNATSAAIVQLCDGRSVAQLAAALAEQFPEADLDDDIRDFLERLGRKGLLRDAAAVYGNPG
jgi:pyrroloquinoline quinone biosynthesis protein D